MQPYITHRYTNNRLSCGSVIKNPLADIGDVDLIPGTEDPLGKEMATHSSILACRIPQPEEPGGLQSMGSLKSQT